MPVDVEILAASLTGIKTLINALETVCFENEASRDTLLKLKQALEAARILVTQARPMRQ